MLSSRPDSLLQEGLVRLVEKAKVQGVLTTEEILDFFPNAIEDADQMVELVALLRRRGVKVVDIDEEGERAADSPEAASFSLDGIAIDDSVSLYLKEMASIPLLKVEEEISLAKRIEAAAQAGAELIRLKPAAASRRQELHKTIQDGIQARDQLIRANTRLVVSVARKYMGRGVPFLDLIQEGNLGLIRAVEKYEYQRGFRFSTYATWWIRQGISRAIADQGRTIRLPVYMAERIQQVYRASQELEQELGHAPTVEDLCSRLEMDSQKVQWLLQLSRVPISLESPVGDDEDAEFGMYIEDHVTPSPVQAAYQNILHEHVEQVLATLTPREARILRLRFGLGTERPYTLEEVGRKFGLTRERIRQIENQALRRLRHPCRAQLLGEYIAGD